MKAKKPLPPGCTPVSCEEDKQKKHYRCPKLGWTISMELRRCSYHDRRSRLIAHIEKGFHIFDIPRDKDELFPKKISISNRITSNDQIQHTVMRYIAFLTSQLNISAKKAVSSEMENFVRLLIKIGIQLKTENPSNSLNIFDIFKISSINKLTDYIKITANEVLQNTLQYYKEKFVSLEMDSGTVNKLICIHFIITIQDSIKIKPFLYNLVKNTNFDSNQYSDKTSSILSELIEKHVYICAVIVDNLRCQTKGLEILKQTSDNPLIKSIFIVHCFCHLTSLVFVNTMKSNTHLGKIVKSIKEIVTILRTNPSQSFIGKKCPKIVETRWLYLYEILVFIENNLNDIQTILIITENDSLAEQLNEILELQKIIKPLR